MERYLEQREKLGRKLNRFTKRLEKQLAQEYPVSHYISLISKFIKITLTTLSN
jgi:hypothetical protein